MKKAMKFLRKNLKVVIGIVIGLSVAGIIVYGAEGYAYESEDVYFNNGAANLTKNGESVANVQDALDALYEKANTASSGVPSMAAMCPGCVYAEYISGNKSSTVVSDSQVTNDYTSLSNNVFLGLIRNENKQVTRVFSCGKVHEKYFCLENNDDSTTHSFYKSTMLLLDIFNEDECKYTYNANWGYITIECAGDNVSLSYSKNSTIYLYGKNYMECRVYPGTTNSFNCGSSI